MRNNIMDDDDNEIDSLRFPLVRVENNAYNTSKLGTLTKLKISNFDLFAHFLFFFFLYSFSVRLSISSFPGSIR